jgi:hypothetical protein
MTVKEKAKELFDKFYQEAPLDEIKFYSNDVMAKSCALIAVDEILKNNLEYLRDVGLHNDVALNIDLSFWEEVKHEINKL